MKCSKCGRSYSEKIKYCTQCGVPLTDDRSGLLQEDTPEMPRAFPEKNERGLKTIWLACGCVLAGLIVQAAVFYNRIDWKLLAEGRLFKTEETETQETETENALPAPQVQMTLYRVTAISLNVRQGPGVDYEEIASLPQGEICIGTGNADAEGKWVEVSYLPDWEKGWINHNYSETFTGTLDQIEQWLGGN